MKPVKPDTVLNIKSNINSYELSALHGFINAHARVRVIHPLFMTNLWENWPENIKKLAENAGNQLVITTFSSVGDEYSSWGAVGYTPAGNLEFGGRFKNPAQMGFSMPALVAMSNVFRFLKEWDKSAVIFTEQDWLCVAIRAGSLIEVSRTERDMLKELRKMAAGVNFSLHQIAPSDNYPARRVSRRKSLPITLQWAAFPQKHFDLSSLPY